MKLTLQNKLEEITAGVCREPENKTYSMIEAMALQQPVGILNKKLFLDKDTYFAVYPNFVQDVENLKRIIQSRDLESDIKNVLGIASDIRILYNKMSNVLCVDTNDKIIPLNVTGMIDGNDTAGANTTEVGSSIWSKFAEYSIIELTLAICAAITTIIAVINSICIAIVSSKKEKGNESAFIDETEMTPLTARKVKFGSDQISQYDPYSSADTFPSPEPVSRRQYIN